MKRLAALTLTASLIAASAHAGGPVVVEEETAVVVAERPATTFPVLPLLLVVGLCVLFCGGDGDDDPEPEPAPPG